MKEAEAIFNSLVQGNTNIDGIAESNFFGFRSISIKRKSFVILFEDKLVFKLDGEALEEAMALKRAARWNPFGRMKKKWIQIPTKHSERWEHYFEMARMSMLAVEDIKN